MANLLPQYELYDEVYDQKTQYRKNKIKSIVIIGNKFTFQQTLNKMREVFDHHRKNSCNKSYDRAQEHEELSMRKILGFPG